MHTKNEKLQTYFSWFLLAASTVAVTVTGIIFKQSLMRIFPLYISLIIGMLQSKANRFSYLLGGINCIIYTVAYISMGVYANALSTLLFSCPLQLITFWRWNKRTYKQSTEFRSLTPRQLLFGIGVLVISFVIIQFALDRADSQYPFLDNITTLLNTAVTVLCLLSLREYSWLMLIAGVFNLSLFACMAADDPAQITYLIYAINSMICIILQFFSVRKLYSEQKGNNVLATEKI